MKIAYDRCGLARRAGDRRSCPRRGQETRAEHGETLAEQGCPAEHIRAGWETCSTETRWRAGDAGEKVHLTPPAPPCEGGEV